LFGGYTYRHTDSNAYHKPIFNTFKYGKQAKKDINNSIAIFASSGWQKAGEAIYAYDS
jgi:hypothetical protein